MVASPTGVFMKPSFVSTQIMHGGVTNENAVSHCDPGGRTAETE